MNQRIATRLTRVASYFNRVRDSLKIKDRTQAMANAAELTFQAEQLYRELDKYRPPQRTNQNQRQSQLERCR